ncbi:hypothetical protein QOZ80_7BG0608730 [Eleusine coracana subsp. coracana]|nr:hypothetical protein QOZ80_7BG0608730 [Eleusine coracana subsp. coracana]
MMVQTGPHDSGRPDSAQEDDDRHSDKTGVHATEDRKQEQGEDSALLDMDDAALSEKILYYFEWLSPVSNDDTPDYDRRHWHEYTPEQLTELYERLAFYRFRGYELSVLDRQLPKLDDAYMKALFCPAVLLEQGYFMYYEESLEWYFDPELCWNTYYDDYQRLTLRDYGDYRDWDRYHLIHNTYEQDLAYVQYCEAMANEIKWIEDYLVDRTIPPWTKVQNVALLQALRVAARLRNVPTHLVSSGLREHIWSINFDHSNYKGMDDVNFEIWKRVSKQNMSFTDALLEIHRQNICPLRNIDIKHELQNNPLRFSMKKNYEAHVACINERVTEDQARLLIKEALIKMRPKSKSYADYAKKKLDIAKDIDMMP